MREWIEEAAARGSEPLLVVPRAEDAGRFERELSAVSALGVSVFTFSGLFSLVARSLDASCPPELSGAQRLAVLRRNVAATELRGGLAQSARQAGFAPELERLLGELQGANLDPAGMAEAAAGNAQLEDLAVLFGAYCEERGRLGRGDTHTTAAAATAALAADPSGWGERPVAFYGFDDMTAEQLELIRRLRGAAPLLATVTYEDRDALAERARLRSELIEAGGIVEAELDRNPAYTASPLLRHLERQLFAEAPEQAEALDDGLVLLEAAGRRGQAEQIAVEVAKLLREEAQSPGDIAIALRSPERDGPLLAAVLAAHGIPAGLQARLPVASTAVGRALVGLLRTTMPNGSAADLLAYLRGPGVVAPGTADGLELALRRSGIAAAADAVGLLRERRPGGGSELRAIDALAGHPDPAEAAEALSRVARRLAEPRRRADGARADAAALELSGAAAVTRTLGELLELGLLEDFCADALTAIEGLAVPATRGSLAGRVLITGPYEIRARPVQNLFVASLQEGEFPAREPGDPLLGDGERGDIELPPRAIHEDEERYVLYTATSRAARRLYLCWRSAEDDGAAAAPSPFIEQIARAIGPLAEELEPRRRDLDRVAPRPEEATTPGGLARALAAELGAEAPRAAATIELGVPGLAAPIAARLAGALARSGKPGPLLVPAVLELLAERRRFGTSTLEEWIACPYKWFVGHELDPAPLGPKAEPLTQGGLAHEVLEALYAERPGGGALPAPETLGTWLRRTAELTGELAERHGLDGARPANAAARARVEALVSAFVSREAAQAAERTLTPTHFEAAFGRGADDGEKEALDLGGFQIHGKIDRIDTGPGGELGAVFDYKTSKKVATGGHLSSAEAIAKHGKLQPGLYAIALRELWQAEPVAALYYALAGTGDHVPRGIFRKDLRETELAGFGLTADKREDNLDEDAFEAALEAARAKAAEIVAAMRAGEIDRTPLNGDCGYCEFASVCRIERAARIEPEPDERDEGEDA